MSRPTTPAPRPSTAHTTPTPLRLAALAVTVFLTALAGPFGQPASAQPQSITPPTPEEAAAAEAVLARHWEAVGGRETAFAQKNRIARGVLRDPASPTPIVITIWQQPPRLWKLRLAVPAGPRQEIGVNEKGAWVTTEQGNAWFQGSRAVELRENAEFYGELNPVRYRWMKAAGPKVIEGVTYDAIDAQTAFGRPAQLLFSHDTGLHFSTTIESIGPEGNAELLTVEYADYKAINNGLKAAHRILQKRIETAVPPTVIEFNKIEANVSEPMDFTEPNDVGPPPILPARIEDTIGNR